MPTALATKTSVAATPNLTPLTAHDRCDRCEAQAYVRVEINPDMENLHFCAHHSRVHETDWMTKGYTILVDERWKLEPKSQKGDVY